MGAFTKGAPPRCQRATIAGEIPKCHNINGFGVFHQFSRRAGFYYEITGYTDRGPTMMLLPWVEPQQRLRTILAIVEDQSADSVRLQQAEEELRQVLHQYTCMLYQVVKGTSKNPAHLNAEKVRKMLIECGIPLPFVNGSPCLLSIRLWQSLKP